MLIYIHPAFIKPESFLSLSFQAPATPVQERVQEAITEGVGVGINMYDSTSMELLAVLKL